MALGKRLAWTLAIVTIVPLLLVAGLIPYLLHTQSGNRSLCRFVGESIAGNLTGRLEVARIDDLGWDHATAHQVRFITPDGIAAIDAPHVVLTFHPLDLLRGEYGWERAEITRPMVRVFENQPGGKTNMEVFFSSPDKGHEPKQPKQDSAPVDLRAMVTHDATLLIGHGSLPELTLTHLFGQMRIQVDPKGDATLRFDDYRGHLAGLPVGDLDFHDVKGQVLTGDGKRLLHFEGAGKNRSEPVDFDLDITRKPTDVHIGAHYASPSMAAFGARLVGLWTKLSSNIRLDVD